MDVSLTKVCNIEDIKENTLNTFTVNGDNLLVLKLQDRYLVANATCPHKGANLGKGKLVDTCTVECPWHHSQINIETGKAVKGPDTTSVSIINNIIKYTLPKLHTYEPVVQGNELYIKGNTEKQKTLLK